MPVVVGIVLGVLYILQPIDALRAPIEWLNSALVTYTGSSAEWLLGRMGDGEGRHLLALIVAVSTPGLAGLALNLIAPLGRMARMIFGIGITVVSLGAFGSLEWHQAILFSLVTSVIGLVLAIAAGPIMEAFAAFMSVILGVSQVRMLLVDAPSPKLRELLDYMAPHLSFMSLDELRLVCAVLALVPTMLIVVWLLWRLSPRRAIVY